MIHPSFPSHDARQQWATWNVNKVVTTPKDPTKREPKARKEWETHFKCQITSHWFACSQLNLNARYIRSLSSTINISPRHIAVRPRDVWRKFLHVPSNAHLVFLSSIFRCVLFHSQSDCSDGVCYAKCWKRLFSSWCDSDGVWWNWIRAHTLNPHRWFIAVDSECKLWSLLSLPPCLSHFKF